MTNTALADNSLQCLLLRLQLGGQARTAFVLLRDHAREKASIQYLVHAFRRLRIRIQQHICDRFPMQTRPEGLVSRYTRLVCEHGYLLLLQLLDYACDRLGSLHYASNLYLEPTTPAPTTDWTELSLCSRRPVSYNVPPSIYVPC